MISGPDPGASLTITQLWAVLGRYVCQRWAIVLLVWGKILGKGVQKTAPDTCNKLD
jgi:hypothetical protein